MFDIKNKITKKKKKEKLRDDIDDQWYSLDFGMEEGGGES